jgi:hypothetical protein
MIEHNFPEITVVRPLQRIAAGIIDQQAKKYQTMLLLTWNLTIDQRAM